MRTNRGSTLIEGLLVLSLMVSLLSGTLWLGTLAFSKVLIDHLLYEALICSHEQRGLNHCENEFIRKSTHILPWGRVLRLKITRSEHQHKGELEWVGPLQKKLELKQSISMGSKSLKYRAAL